MWQSICVGAYNVEKKKLRKGDDGFKFDPLCQLSMSLIFCGLGWGGGIEGSRWISHRNDDIEWPTCFFIYLFFGKLNLNQILFDFILCRRPKVKWRRCSRASNRRLTNWVRGAKLPRWGFSDCTRNSLTSPVSRGTLNNYYFFSFSFLGGGCVGGGGHHHHEKAIVLYLRDDDDDDDESIRWIT